MPRIRSESFGTMLGSERSFSIGLAFLIVAVIWIFVPQLASPFQIKGHLAAAGALLLVLLFATSRHQTPWKIPRGMISLALLMLLLSAIVSAVAATNKLLAGAQLALLFPLLTLSLCIFNLRTDTDAIRIETALLVAALGVALLALEQWLLPDVLDPGFDAVGKMRVYSTLGNSNLAAFVLLAALPIAFFRAYRTYGRQRAIAWSALSLLGVALFATQSRQGLLIAMLLVPIGFAWLGSPRQRTIALVSIGAIIAVVAAASFLHLIGWPPTLIHTVKGRILIWACAISMLAEHPVSGVGLGHFDLYHTQAQAILFASGHYDAFADNAGAVKDAHNDFLHWGATAGALSMVAFAALCLSVLSKSWRCETLRIRRPGIYLSLIGCIGMMLSTAAIPYAATALVFWVVLGLVLRQCEVDWLEWKPATSLSYSYGALLVAVLAAIGTWSYRDLRAELLEARGNRLMQQHDAWLAQQAYRDALSWSRNGERLKYHATTLFLTDEPRAALIELDEASRYSGDIGIPILRAEILTRLGEYDRAVGVYQGLIAAFPKLITPRFVLAQIYALRGERDLAQAQFRQVVDIDPSPFNLSMTREKVELQKAIARRYLQDTAPAQRP